MTTLSYQDAPRDWVICFQHECSLRDRCLRYAVAQLAPADLTHHATVLPAAREGERCSLFATAEPVRIARGMTNIMSGARPGMAAEIRPKLIAIFGSRTHFYRYRNGEYDITPEQQERVISLLRKYGYRGEEPFDHYSTQFYFPKP